MTGARALLAAASIALAAAAPARAVDPAAAVDFAREIRPILSRNCFACHGPDGAARKAGLRLDTAEGVFAQRERGPSPIVRGNADASVLIERVSASDPDDRMPPPATNKRLSADEIDLLRRWIDEGAPWEEHWSFVPPRRPDPPPVSDPAWVRNPIDRFVLARLEREGITPAPEADRETLIRRATFDLTGLPPTLEEIDAFLGDRQEGHAGAYQRVVDRLLASPRYGERMAMSWLDAARYADTNGYHYDNERFMWRWREWVIDAYNRNLPYDQFTIEQLAGDLLDAPTAAQRIATGFNRNHGISWEGGIIPEEYRVEYVVDRVNTTSTVWLGLTAGCARCHDHKFDPISMREFYELAAFFNSVDEKGSDGLAGNAAPFVSAPDPADAEALAGLTDRIELLEIRRDLPAPELDAAQAEWETHVRDRLAREWTVLEPFAYKALGGATLSRLDDGSLLADGVHPEREVYEIVALTSAVGITALRLDALAHESLPDGGPGRASHSNYLLSAIEVEAAPVSDPQSAEPVRFVAAVADYSQPKFHVGGAIDQDPETGWAVEGGGKGEDHVALFLAERPFGFPGGTALRVRLRYESRYTRHAMGRVRLAASTDAEIARAITPSALGAWAQSPAQAAADGAEAFGTVFLAEPGAEPEEIAGTDEPEWTLRPDLVDGRPHGLEVGENSAVYFRRTIRTDEPRRMQIAFGSDDAIKAWVDDELVLASVAPRGVAPDQNLVTVDLAPGEHRVLVKIVNYGGQCGLFFDRRRDDALDPPLEIAALLARPEPRLGDDHRARLRDWYRARHSPEQRELIAELERLKDEAQALRAKIPTTMVMRDLEQPRDTFVLMRGRYDTPGAPVHAAVPGVLPPLPPGAPPNRLGLARWITDEGNPLTARVGVNRLWQQCFGTGLVETAEDFGAQGSVPTHPGLLDWLAVEFVASGWDVKRLLRLIVTSAAYRQDSRIVPELHAMDPGNRRLGRGARFRLPAEMIRDNALAASGLLVERIGGPSVKPYQPAGLWKEIGSEVNAFSANVYEQDRGEGLYRRSMYTFWKRTLPPPSLRTFDAPTREFCLVRRSRTNTPLQALVLLNDPTYVEAARALARRAMLQGGSDPAERTVFAFRLATARHPDERETGILVDLYHDQLERFRADPAAARQLLQVGELRHEESLDPAELAAWTVVTNTILNLDETITKG